MTRRFIVVGAGPVGSLAALYCARNGHEVEIYELRSDLRDPATIPLNFTKSINLALSERGVNAMRHLGNPELLNKVLATTIPMEGRMIHMRSPNGKNKQLPQKYDIHGRTILAVDRETLNARLLDLLEKTENVKLFFNHKFITADFDKRVARFERRDLDNKDSKTLIDVKFDMMIGADGAHSLVRNRMMRYVKMDFQQHYIDTLWCEFQIKAVEGKQAQGDARFRISPHHLHIWPGTRFMFIAIPCSVGWFTIFDGLRVKDDGSFTCTLFLPSAEFTELESAPSKLPAFFDEHFPGVTDLIPGNELQKSFKDNPHLPLITVKCSPYHYSSSVVILGDAAHAMVPFYGQGLNAGMEDVNVLFSLIEKYTSNESEYTFHEPSEMQYSRALSEYTQVRSVDAHAINDLALENYEEMRAGVLRTSYRWRKWLEELLTVHAPSLGWQTKYARVSFSNERYSSVIKNSNNQGKAIKRLILGAMLLGQGAAAFTLLYLLFGRRKQLFKYLVRWLDIRS